MKHVTRITNYQRLLLSLIVIHVVLVGGYAIRYGFAWTEVGLLPAGILDWQVGNFDAFRVNPPLVRLWATLPLLPFAPEVTALAADIDPRDRLEWTLARSMLESNPEAAHRWLVLSRLFCLPFTITGMYVASRWARELYGSAAGIGAALLWAFLPNNIGYGCLISGDAQAASMGLLTLYLFRSWLKRPCLVETYQLGLVLGLTMLCKSSWLILCGLLPGLCLVIGVVQYCKRNRDMGPQKADTMQSRIRQLVSLASALVIALFVVNLMYGFAGSFRRLDSNQFISKTLAGSDDWQAYAPYSGNRFAGTWLGCLPVPFPEDLVIGVDLQKWDFDRERWSYFRGQWRNHGWWYYYLYGMAIKLPLGFWLLFLIAATGFLLRASWRVPWQQELLLWTPMLLILIGASLETGLNRHLRYVLPAMPFAIVIASRTFRVFDVPHRTLRPAVAVATVWIIASSLWIYPHSLSYFNESIGGPYRADKYLNASNLDWGQDLPYLRRWQQANAEKRPLMVTNYLHIVDPSAAGIQTNGAVPSMPTHRDHRTGLSTPEFYPGWYAIDRETLLRRSGEYQYLRQFEPSAWAGYGFQIYEISIEQAATLQRQWLDANELTIPQ